MRSVLFVLVLVLCLSMPAYALEIPGDLNHDKVVSQDELVSDILAYLSAAYLGGDVQHLNLTQLREAAHIHMYYPRTIVDSANRTVTIYRPIKRAVVFNSETVETLRSLHADDRIVGVGKYTIQNTLLFSEFTHLPNVGSVWSPNYEQVLACHPDTVFLYGTISVSKCDAIQNKLIELDPDITVIRMDCYMPGSYVDEVRKLGYLLEKEDEASRLIEFYQAALNPIYEGVRDIPEENRTKVYIECWRSYHTAGNGSGWDEKVELAGGNNIFHDLSDYPDVDAESVALRDPQVIIRIAKTEGGYDAHDSSELRALRDEILRRPELGNVSAVKNGKIYVISNDIFGGVRHFIGMQYVAKWLYPDRFGDLDPQAVHRQYLTEFQGLNATLADNGVFVSPEV
ncbi:ABC transporter substrate-binding protein [Methermicoccus shengliensis]|uniref:ABC transporter substrate-binding protein n=1 Tax=Methermicoccus shengliensis TaxID=660064 RepID=A0A832VZD8_9EURY|nr:ABC transporter substrate-binding protein [Methermicoccus shengliensis]KUK29683.1 MAG: Periplasmic binding protein [Methanosarcinales archeaon 56_1174]MDI3488141.1 iron complex transport system substrate-binding protein [Methanosarcinales archaeon]HIH69230.1 ABC transporter substrate-binding protein [Methermicoccus shengliensis]